MTMLTRDDLIETGFSLPARPLIAWVRVQLDAVRGKERRLEARGMDATALAGLHELLAHVARRQQEMGDGYETPTPAVSRVQDVREEASAFWRELKLMAWVEFGTQPEVLARFRTGVRSGLLVSNLLREIGIGVELLREFAPMLEPLGADDGFRQQGRALLEQLAGAKTLLESACRELPPTVAQQFHDKGLLYDRTRRLVRTGRLAFHQEPSLASEFDLAAVQAARGSRPVVRRKKVRAGAR